jgi:hypothetical protein
LAVTAAGAPLDVHGIFCGLGLFGFMVVDSFYFFFLLLVPIHGSHKIHKRALRQEPWLLVFTVAVAVVAVAVTIAAVTAALVIALAPALGSSRPVLSPVV